MKAGKLPSVRARRLLRAIIKCGFRITRIDGSYKFLRNTDGRSLLFAFHDRETIGPSMLSRILKDSGISIEELRKAL